MAGRAVMLGKRTLMVPVKVFNALELYKVRGKLPVVLGKPNPLAALRKVLITVMPGFDVWDVASAQAQLTLSDEAPKLTIPRVPAGVELTVIWKKVAGRLVPTYPDWKPSAEDYLALPAVWDDINR